MTNAITKKTQICKGCGQEYEAHTGHVMGIVIEFGQGYCRICCDKAMEEEANRQSELEQKLITTKREEYRHECGLPLRFRASKFTSFDKKVDRTVLQAWRQCGEYAEKFSFRNPQLAQSLLMYSHGVWGVGKTYLVCAIANAILDKWNGEVSLCPVLFISEPQLFLRIRASYNRRYGEDWRNETEDEIYTKLTNVPLLILDDIGKEEVSDARFVQRVLFAIIDGRYQRMLPIVMTANLTPDQLDSHLGGDRGNSASMDRLVEMTGNVFYELKGSTYRDVSKRVSR